MMRYAIPCLALVTLTACLTERASQRGRDRDRDGHDAWQLDGSDCNDEDPAINPDQPEVCGNGVDDNCDGLVDDDGVGALTWYPDADGDGAVGTASETGCVAPAGSRPDLSGDIDCDDGSASVHPGAEEIWYDGVDQNCDGNDSDRDEDGEDSIEGGGLDCDDDDSGVNTWAVEVCNNGIDDNCDGGANHCAAGATRGVEDAIASVPSRAEAVRILDVNSDGIDDLIIHESERTSAYFGPLRSLVPSGAADLRVTHASANAGRAVDFANLDNTPPLDWILGDRGNERVAVWWNPASDTGRADVGDLPTLIEAQNLTEPALFGRSLRVVRGLSIASGDGLVVGSRLATTTLGGESFAMGIRFYAGPWTNTPRSANSLHAMVAEVGVEQFGAYRFFGFVPTVVFVGESEGESGLFAVSVPFSVSEDTMTVYEPLLSVQDSFSDDGDYLLNLPGPRGWMAESAPFPVSHFGLTATGELATGGGVYPLDLDIADSERTPTAVTDLPFVAASQVPVGNPDGEDTYFLVDTCTDSPFGQVFVSAILDGGADSESTQAILGFDELSAGLDQASVIAADVSAVDIECGDLDADGVNDLIVADPIRQRVLVFKGTGW